MDMDNAIQLRILPNTLVDPFQNVDESHHRHRHRHTRFPIIRAMAVRGQLHDARTLSFAPLATSRAAIEWHLWTQCIVKSELSPCWALLLPALALCLLTF